jgi:hypothetical protein
MPTRSGPKVAFIRSVLIAALFQLSSGVCGQSFFAGGGPIPDDASVAEFPISVSGLVPPEIDTVGFGLEEVCVDIEHTRAGDLELSLVAPDGTVVLLVMDVGEDDNDFTNTCFRGDAVMSIAAGSAPFTGAFLPMGQLGIVNNGQVGNGTWKLRVTDLYPGASGQLNAVTITFGTSPASYITIASSDLPIVFINTNGVQIPDEPKLAGIMGIIDNGPGNLNYPGDAPNAFEGRIGIEKRGNSSQSFAKKSYGLETWDDLDNDLDVSLLGMPAESDWVLIANHSDKSLLNNALAFDLFQRMGHYAPRWRFVELFVNDTYVGVYLLTEKIKRGAERVDIAKLAPVDTVGDELTGGYIIKIDWTTGSTGGIWESPYTPPGAANGQTILFLYDYPTQPVPLQQQYIQAYVDSFETALASANFTDPVEGWRRYLGSGTTIDLFLLNELSRNVDGYRQSTYLYKDKASNGGKLKMGPVWDYDVGWSNSNYCNGSEVEGWAYEHAEPCPLDQNLPPFWWDRLLQDEAFANSLRCRWETLREDVLSTGRLHQWCDSMASELTTGVQNNFTAWPILGMWLWPNPQPVPLDHAGEVQELKDWISERAGWLDEHIPGDCITLVSEEVALDQQAFSYPDPFTDAFTVRMAESCVIEKALLIDGLGRSIELAAGVKQHAREHAFSVQQDLSAGPYVLVLHLADRVVRVPVMRVAIR